MCDPNFFGAIGLFNTQLCSMLKVTASIGGIILMFTARMVVGDNSLGPTRSLAEFLSSLKAAWVLSSKDLSD